MAERQDRAGRTQGQIPEQEQPGQQKPQEQPVKLEQSEQPGQQDILFEQAKALAARDTIDSLTRAAELLSQLPSCQKVKKLTERCLNRVMVLEARARERRRKYILIFSAAVLVMSFSLYIYFGIIMPQVSYRTGPAVAQTGTGSGGNIRTQKNSDSKAEPASSDSGGNESGEKGSAENDSGDPEETYASLIPVGEADPDAFQQGAEIRHSDSDPDWDPAALQGNSETVTALVTGKGAAAGGSGMEESPGSAAVTPRSGSEEQNALTREGNAQTDGPSDADPDAGDSSSDAGPDMVSSGLSAPDTAEGMASGSSPDGSHSAGASGLSSENNGQESDSRSSDGSEKKNKGRNSQDPVSYLILLAVSAAVFLGIRLRNYLKAERQYRRAVALIHSGQYAGAMSILRSLNGYRDSAARISGCRTAIRDEHYSKAVSLKDCGKLEDAISAFDLLGNYKDSAQQIETCRNSMQERNYQAAMDLFAADDYDGAWEAFAALEGYRDSRRMMEKCRKFAQLKLRYEEGVRLDEEGRRQEAEAVFSEIPGYKDADRRLAAIRQNFYDEAKALLDAGNCQRAQEKFTALKDFGDSAQMAAACRRSLLDREFSAAASLQESGRYEDAMDAFLRLTDHPEGKSRAEACRKLVRVPQPFTGAAHGMAPEALISLMGDPSERKTSADGKTELLYAGIPFMGADGRISAVFAENRLESINWTADLSGAAAPGVCARESGNTAPGSGSHRGPVNGDRLYAAITKRYTLLFGRQVSDRSSAGHRVAWWTDPALTVDYSKDRYLHILY